MGRCDQSLPTKPYTMDELFKDHTCMYYLFLNHMEMQVIAYAMSISPRFSPAVQESARGCLDNLSYVMNQYMNATGITDMDEALDDALFHDSNHLFVIAPEHVKDTALAVSELPQRKIDEGWLGVLHDVILKCEGPVTQEELEDIVRSMDEEYMV